ncbi:MAG: hypothetical protein JST79_15900 [Acidobacteria bacterium]|nr:hypothetical protein [Acidobacteriota bacterium]
MSEPSRSGRIKDWLLYVAISILIVISIWMFAMHQARIGDSPNLPLKWLGFAGMTVIIFGNAIRAYRRFWGRRRFWLFLGLFSSVHSCLGVIVLLRVAVPLWLYAVLTGPEYLLLAAYLDYFLNSD